MSELIELLLNPAHWGFEIISGTMFFAIGAITPERFNPVKRLITQHDKEHHNMDLAGFNADEAEAILNHANRFRLELDA